MNKSFREKTSERKYFTGAKISKNICSSKDKKFEFAKQVQTNRPEQYKCILVQGVLCKCKGEGYSIISLWLSRLTGIFRSDYKMK